MKRRRHLTLLEVLIALTLVVLFALPLVAPHVGMYREQRRWAKSIQEDLKQDAWYAELYEALLMQKVTIQEGENHFNDTNFDVKLISKKGKNPQALLYEIRLENGKKYALAAKKKNSHPS